MNEFKDFGIKSTPQGFVGEKININKILNREITVYDFRIEPSKFDRENKKCLYMQIEFNGDKRLVFIGSASLINMIEQVPKTKFPFKTTIVKENERLEFS